nr:hypothetical protein BaRGS_029644 [Batillaria attramentaria]
MSESESSEDDAHAEKAGNSDSPKDNKEKEKNRKDKNSDKTGEEKKSGEGPPAQKKYERHTTAGDMSEARKRFLARKLARERARPVVDPE